MVGYLRDAFWRFLPDAARAAARPRIEQTLRDGIAARRDGEREGDLLQRVLRSMAHDAGGVAFLERVWRRQEKIPGLPLAEPDEATMALELAVRGVPNAAAILDEQRARFTNPDRKARFEFVMPALSADPRDARAFFASLADVEEPPPRAVGRRRARLSEPPAARAGVGAATSGRRSTFCRRFSRPATSSSHELDGRGPRRPSIEGGRRHRSTFLAEQPDYPVRLRRVILQSADDLFRAASM